MKTVNPNLYRVFIFFLSFFQKGGIELKLSTLTVLIQGMVDGSASKPALRQDTGYMV